MEKGNKDDSELYNVNVLLNQLNKNIRFYDELPLKQFDKHFSDLFSRLKMQKDLFIKEVHRVFKIDDSIDNNENPTINIVNDSIKDPESGATEQWIAILNEKENLLIKNYDTVLSDENLSEIAQMILRNHRNELTRDLRNLNDLKVKFDQ